MVAPSITLSALKVSLYLLLILFMDLCSLYVERAIVIDLYLIRTKMSHFPGFQSDTPYVILPGASIPDIDGIASSKGGGKGDGFRKFKKHL